MPGPFTTLFRLRLRLERKLGHPPPKVFCVGFNKTGTTSLHRLFVTLGFRSYHGLRWHDLTDRDVYEAHDCFSDGFPLDWRSLPLAYPDARFVLNVRDCRSWLLSRLRHIRRSKEDGTYTGGSSWGVWDDTVEAVQSWIRDWHDHHLDVLHAFEEQPERLLVVNITSDPEAGRRVASFLGCPGRVQTPHANSGRRGAVSGRYEGMIEQACGNLGIPLEQLDDDLSIPALGEGRGPLAARRSEVRHAPDHDGSERPL